MGKVVVLAPTNAETAEQLLQHMMQRVQKFRNEGCKRVHAAAVLIFETEDGVGYSTGWSADAPKMEELLWAAGILQRRAIKAVEDFNEP